MALYDRKYTVRDRGTECIKSPEMIAFAIGGGAASKAAPGSAAGAGGGDVPPSLTPAAAAACDVWSVGCLLFELVTGTHLFSGEEWGSFYVRLTAETMDLIPPHKASLLPSAHRQLLLNFLTAVLQRKPEGRPTIAQVRALYGKLRAAVRAAGPRRHAPAGR